MSALVQFFAYGHLPPHLQERSKPFAVAARELSSDSLQRLANHLAETLPPNEEGDAALHKLATAASLLAGEGHNVEHRVIRLLIEAKDCAVRAHLFKDGEFAIDAEGKAVAVAG